MIYHKIEIIYSFILGEKMTETTLLAKAVKELNEKDEEGALAKIKMHIKLVQKNDEEISKLQKNNRELLKEVQKLNAAGAMTPDRFAADSE